MRRCLKRVLSWLISGMAVRLSLPDLAERPRLSPLQVTQIMVPLLKFYFHEDVRQAAVQAMPELLRSASLAVAAGRGPDTTFVKQMLDFIWTPLMEAMAKVLHVPPRCSVPLQGWLQQLLGIRHGMARPQRRPSRVLHEVHPHIKSKKALIGQNWKHRAQARPP